MCNARERQKNYNPFGMSFIKNILPEDYEF